MPDNKPYAQVIVDIASANTDRVFTYSVPEGMALAPGTRVLVPFGRQTIEGLVISLSDTCDLPEEKVKSILEPLEDYPAVLPPLVELAREISADAHTPLALALRLMIPAEMRSGA